MHRPRFSLRGRRARLRNRLVLFPPDSWWGEGKRETIPTRRTGSTPFLFKVENTKLRAARTRSARASVGTGAAPGRCRAAEGGHPVASWRAWPACGPALRRRGPGQHGNAARLYVRRDKVVQSSYSCSPLGCRQATLLPGGLKDGSQAESSAHSTQTGLGIRAPKPSAIVIRGSNDAELKMRAIGTKSPERNPEHQNPR